MEWDRYPDHKLHRAQPKVGDSFSSHARSRREQSLLCRLHIGRLLLTHFYLLNGEERPHVFLVMDYLLSNKVDQLCRSTGIPKGGVFFFFFFLKLTRVL